MRNLYPILLLLAFVLGRASSFRTFNYNGYDYIFSSDSHAEYGYSWYEARAYCLEWGTDLLTIENEAENDWIMTATPWMYGGM